MKTKTTLRSFFAIAASSLLAMSFANAQSTLYFDGTPTTANGASSGGTGTWDLTTANWDNGTGYVAWINANGDNAVVTGTANITIGEAITVGTLSLASSGTTSRTIGGSAEITINNGMLLQNFTSLSWTAPIRLGGSQTWTHLQSANSTGKNITGVTNLNSHTLTWDTTATPLNNAINHSNISGNGNIIKNGTGWSNLLTNTYTGITTINNGTLNMGNATALGNVNNELTVNGGTLNMVANSLTVGNLTGTGGVISGSSGTRTLTIGSGDAGGGNFQGAIQNGSGGTTALTKIGTGTITLSGANTYTGATTISAGILSLGNASALGSSTLDTTASIAGTSTSGLRTTVATLTLGALSGNKDLSSVFTTTSGGYDSVTALTLNPGSGATPGYSGIIANGASGMSLTKSGAGTQILSGNNTYGGTTTINGGTLILSGNNTYSGATTISDGTLLGVAGGSCANSAVTVNPTTVGTLGVRVDDNTKQWTCASLTTDGTSPTLAYGFTTTPSASLAPLNVTGDLTFTVTPFITVDPAAYLVSGQSYPLIVVGGTAPTGVTPSVTIGRGLMGTTSWTGNTLYLNVAGTSTLPLKWNINGNGTWDINTTANWNDNTPTAVNYLDGSNFVLGDSVVIDETPGTAAKTITLNTLVKPASVTINNPTGAVTISGTGGIIGGGSVTKSGAGVVTLSTVNTYYGGFTLNNGQVGSLPASGTYTGFGTGTLTINGGSIRGVNTSSAVIIPNNVAWNASFGMGRASGGSPIFTFNGTMTLNGSVGTTAISTSEPFSLVFNGNIGEATLGSSLNLSTASSGGGATFNGQNTFTGGINTNGKSLVIGSSGYLGGGSYGGAISCGAFTYSSSANQTLSGNITTASSLTKNTSSMSVLTLTGQNSYTGATAINAGTLRVATGTGTRNTSAITIANTAGCVFGVQLAAANGQWASTSTLTLGGANSEIQIDYGSTVPTTNVAQAPAKVTTLTVSGVGTVRILGNAANFTANTTYPLINGTTAVPAAADPYTGLNLILPVGVTGHLKTVAKELQLVVDSVGGDPYVTWSGGAPFSEDANGDGVTNGLAFLLGAATPGANATGLLPTTSQTGGNLVMNFTCLASADRGTATLNLEYDGDLGGTWLSVPVPGAVGAPNPIVENTTTGSVSFEATDGGTNGNGDALIDVEATISDATESASGKLFGRLKGTKP